MGPPTVAQRIEQLEEKTSNIEELITEMVTKAFERGLEAMRHSVTELVMENQALTSKNMGAEIEALSERLEGRINRSREYQEALINTIRTDQLKFQTEIKSVITGLQSGQIFPTHRMEDGAIPPGSSSSKNGSVLLGPEDSNKGLGNRTLERGFAGGMNLGNGIGIGSNSGVGHWRYRKLDMPVFDGSDPVGWLLRVERYFAFYKLTEEEMLEAVAVAMDSCNGW